nr:hypothetical protein Iba_chr12eCG6110 [Ipomoea batatas]
MMMMILSSMFFGTVNDDDDAFLYVFLYAQKGIEAADEESETAVSFRALAQASAGNCDQLEANTTSRGYDTQEIQYWQQQDMNEENQRIRDIVQKMEATLAHFSANLGSLDQDPNKNSSNDDTLAPSSQD